MSLQNDLIAHFVESGIRAGKLTEARLASCFHPSLYAIAVVKGARRAGYEVVRLVPYEDEDTHDDLHLTFAAERVLENFCKEHGASYEHPNVTRPVGVDAFILRAERLLEALEATTWTWETDQDQGVIEAAEGGVVAYVPPFANVNTVHRHGTQYSHPIAEFIAASPELVRGLLAKLKESR